MLVFPLYPCQPSHHFRISKLRGHTTSGYKSSSIATSPLQPHTLTEKVILFQLHTSVYIMYCVCFNCYSGTLLSICMCHPRTRENLKLWVDQVLEKMPALANMTVIYDIKEYDISEDEQIKKLNSVFLAPPKP